MVQEIDMSDGESQQGDFILSLLFGMVVYSAGFDAISALPTVPPFSLPSICRNHPTQFDCLIAA